MVERLYQELENGMTDDEKSDLRKNLIDFDKQRKFYKVKFQKESYLKKINKKFNYFQVRTTLKNVLQDSKYDEMSNRWMNRDVGGKRQCVVVKNFNQTLVDSGVFRSLIDPSLERHSNKSC